jgi:predicted ATP-grasp superfamily ATP-dependent carboligase
MDALVTDVHIRSVVAGLRGLGRGGVRSIAVAPCRMAAGRWSRYAAKRATVPDPAGDPIGHVAKVVALAERHGPLVVYPGREVTINALFQAAPDLPEAVVLPYRSPESLARLRDKRELASLAEGAGLSTPRVLYEGAVADIDPAALAFPCAVKPARPGSGLWSTAIASSPGELDAVVSALPAGEPVLVQERARGALVSVAVVVGRDGALAACFQQVASRTWPADAGVSSRALSVDPDAELAERVRRLLTGAGYVGLAQLQFLDSDRGRLLIDVNPRFYGSLPLALAAGVNLPHVWHRVVSGEMGIEPEPYRVGLAYRWLEADIVDAFHGDMAALMRRPPRLATGALWAADDPVASALLAAAATRERVAQMVRGRVGRVRGGG